MKLDLPITRFTAKSFGFWLKGKDYSEIFLFYLLCIQKNPTLQSRIQCLCQSQESQHLYLVWGVIALCRAQCLPPCVLDSILILKCLIISLFTVYLSKFPSIFKLISWGLKFPLNSIGEIFQVKPWLGSNQRKSLSSTVSIRNDKLRPRVTVMDAHPCAPMPRSASLGNRPFPGPSVAEPNAFKMLNQEAGRFKHSFNVQLIQTKTETILQLSTKTFKCRVTL